MRKYILDPYIVSILYQTETDEDALKHYQEIVARMMQLVTESIKYFFSTEKKLPQDQVEAILLSIDTGKTENLSPEIIEMLKSEELGKIVTDSVDSLGKILYESLLPTLDADSRKELNKYLETIEPILKENTLNILSTMLPIYNEKTDLNTIATEEPVLKSEENIVVSPPSINLGGVNTNIPTPAQETVQTEAVTVHSPEIYSTNVDTNNPIENPNDVDIPEGSAVDMALQSAINPSEQQVFTNETPVENLTELPSALPEEVVSQPEMSVPTSVNLGIPTDMPKPPVPEQVQAEVTTPESMIENEIQFTPLTEVPQVDQGIQQTAAETVMNNPVLDNQLPPLPTDTLEQIVSSQQTETVDQNQTDINQPISAINRLDGLGINLDEPVNNTQQ